VKNRKPVHYILGGSAVIVGVTLIVVLILDYQLIDFPYWVLFGLPFLMGLISFGVFYLFVEKLINERLRILYRSIKTKKGSEKPITFKMTEDIFGSAEQTTKRWNEERNTEISKLQEQENFRREFIGNLAHELKTPVFSIQGYIDTLLDGGLEDEKVNRMFLERASVSIDRMVSLLEDLDELTKLETNTIKLEKSNFDLKNLAEEVMQSLELKASNKNITLAFSRDYTPQYVNADRSKIAQVLTNLINNSINYGNEYGRTSVRFFEMDELLLIEISDNGPGIDSKHLPRLFERFYRVEKSRTRNEGGSGLGLSIVKQIIEAHKHSVSVRSTVGIGTTFAFSLDRAKNTPEVLLTSRGIPIR
jgi:two-component system phosphate regulon sensor histidine kinase PhoR